MSKAHRLLKLAEKFADFVTKKNKPVIDVTDVTVKDEENALHEERETGLQDGVREVPLDTGTEAQSLGEDGASEGSQ